MQIAWSNFHSTYSEAEVKRHVPREAGVYLLWVKLKNDKWRCFYTGQSKDLEARLLEHLSDNEENECLKTRVSKYICGFEYAKVGLQRDRDGVEKFLYNHYKPEYNESDPGGESIEVNLP